MGWMSNEPFLKENSVGYLVLDAPGDCHQGTLHARVSGQPVQFCSTATKARTAAIAAVIVPIMVTR
jgi:hypothetical protein